jgi:hypothetical protein
MAAALFQWDWVVRVVYISDGETAATVALGSTTRQIPIHQGLNQYFFQLTGAGDHVTVTPASSGATLCFGTVTVGVPTPLLKPA